MEVKDIPTKELVDEMEKVLRRLTEVRNEIERRMAKEVTINWTYPYPTWDYDFVWNGSNMHVDKADCTAEVKEEED